MTMLQTASWLGRRTIDAVRIAGRSVLFLAEAVSYGFVPPFRPREITRQTAFIGARSLLIILVTGAFTGMVLGLQGCYTLRRFGSEGMLGSMVALSIIRELGPVLSALMVAGRAGSSVAAEIGVMKVTEQLNALEMMAVNPVKFVVTPKIVAGLISLPLLTAIFDVMGIFGGYVVGVQLLGVSEGGYFGDMARAVNVWDILGGLIKSLAFGLSIFWVCTFTGYSAEASTEGVASAATRAVVASSVAILALDYLLTSLML